MSLEYVSVGFLVRPTKTNYLMYSYNWNLGVIGELAINNMLITAMIKTE